MISHYAKEERLVGPAHGRPRPMGPIALLLRRGSSSLVLDVGSWRNSCRNTVAPSYKYKGGGREWNTHLTSHALQGILA